MGSDIWTQRPGNPTNPACIPPPPSHDLRLLVDVKVHIWLCHSVQGKFEADIPPVTDILWSESNRTNCLPPFTPYRPHSSLCTLTHARPKCLYISSLSDRSPYRPACHPLSVPVPRYHQRPASRTLSPTLLQLSRFTQNQGLRSADIPGRVEYCRGCRGCYSRDHIFCLCERSDENENLSGPKKYMMLWNLKIVISMYQIQETTR